MRSNDSLPFPRGYDGADRKVQFLLIENVEEQIKPINDDQANHIGSLNLFYSRSFANASLSIFKDFALYEFEEIMKKNDSFKSKKFQEEDYKFALVDINKEITEYDAFDEVFFEVFMDSLMNIMIVGKNFDIEKFKQHVIFIEWFDNKANKYIPFRYKT